MLESAPAQLAVAAFAATAAWALFLVAFFYTADLGHSRSAGMTLACFAVIEGLLGVVAFPAHGLVIKCIAASLLLSGLAKLRLAYRIGGPIR